MNPALDPSVEEFIRLSPYVAVLRGKGEEERWSITALFETLSDGMKQVLTSPSTVDALKAWSGEGLLPATHIEAVAKIIGLVALEEIDPPAVEQLLLRLDLSQNQASAIAGNIHELLSPALQEQAGQEVHEIAETELPPMTRPTEKGPLPLAGAPARPGPRPPERNILNLRDKPQV